LSLLPLLVLAFVDDFFFVELPLVEPLLSLPLLSLPLLLTILVFFVTDVVFAVDVNLLGVVDNAPDPDDDEEDADADASRSELVEVAAIEVAGFTIKSGVVVLAVESARSASLSSGTDAIDSKEAVAGEVASLTSLADVGTAVSSVSTLRAELAGCGAMELSPLSAPAIAAMIRLISVAFPINSRRIVVAPDD
jgi:hypothetical protein